MKRAFTLIELLVVIAIIAILAAILFPVFAQAKEAAKKTADLSNMKQWCTSYQIYTADVDDVAVLTQYRYSFDVRTGDRDWGNLLYPYTKNKDLFKTPNSPFSVANRIVDAAVGPNPNTMPTPQLKDDQTLFNLGWLTDYGYNYQIFEGFFSGPPFANQDNVGFAPISMTSINDSGKTLLLITGIFDRDTGGNLKDGGQLPIDPPCRRYVDGTDTLAPAPAGATGRWYYGGWLPSTPLAWNVYGGVWPYYSGPRASVGFADGHAKTMTITQVAQGCDVRDNWGGRITDGDAYIWDGIK